MIWKTCRKTATRPLHSSKAWHYHQQMAQQGTQHEYRRHYPNDGRRCHHTAHLVPQRQTSGHQGSHNRPLIPCPNKTGRGDSLPNKYYFKIVLLFNFIHTLILELTKVSSTFVSCSRRVWCAISYNCMQNWCCTHVAHVLMYNRLVLMEERWNLIKNASSNI